MEQETLKKMDAVIEMARFYSDSGNLTKADELFDRFFRETNTNVHSHPFTMTIDEMNNAEVLKLKSKAVFFYAIQCRRSGRYQECFRMYDIAFMLYGDLEELEKEHFWMYRFQRLQVQANIAFVHDETGNFEMANQYIVFALSAYMAINIKFNGKYLPSINELVGALEKLYDKYNKPKKKEMLRMLMNTGESDDLNKLLQ